jgi:hypothetical protein
MVREALVDKLGYGKRKNYELNIDKLIYKYQQGVTHENLLMEGILDDQSSMRQTEFLKI